jgi:hypothetical protein
MSLVMRSLLTLSLLAVLAPAAGAAVVKQERVPGGALEQTWSPGFGVGRVFTALTLPAGDPAIPSPTGDNTVAVLQNVATNLGGIAACATDPSGFADYTWEGDFFTGGGSTRVGLILRADPSDGFQTFYQFVINPGLFQIRFRKFVAGAPLPDLASWLATVLPGGVPTANSWHHMKVEAMANSFRCFFDGTELTAAPIGAPIVDTTAPILGGWVGAYNFSASVGEVPVYFDNLTLSIDGVVPTRTSTWASVKKLYR